MSFVKLLLRRNLVRRKTIKTRSCFAGNCEARLHPGSHCKTNGILEPVAEDKAEFSLNLSSFFEAGSVSL